MTDVYGWAVHTAQLLRDKKMLEAMPKAYKISMTLIEKETPFDLKLFSTQCP